MYFSEGQCAVFVRVVIFMSLIVFDPCVNSVAMITVSARLCGFVQVESLGLGPYDQVKGCDGVCQSLKSSLLGG